MREASFKRVCLSVSQVVYPLIIYLSNTSQQIQMKELAHIPNRTHSLINWGVLTGAFLPGFRRVWSWVEIITFVHVICTTETASLVHEATTNCYVRIVSRPHDTKLRIISSLQDEDNSFSCRKIDTVFRNFLLYSNRPLTAHYSERIIVTCV